MEFMKLSLLAKTFTKILASTLIETFMLAKTFAKILANRLVEIFSDLQKHLLKYWQIHW